MTTRRAYTQPEHDGHLLAGYSLVVLDGGEEEVSCVLIVLNGNSSSEATPLWARQDNSVTTRAYTICSTQDEAYLNTGIHVYRYIMVPVLVNGAVHHTIHAKCTVMQY